MRIGGLGVALIKLIRLAITGPAGRGGMVLLVVVVVALLLGVWLEIPGAGVVGAVVGLGNVFAGVPLGVGVVLVVAEELVLAM